MTSSVNLTGYHLTFDAEMTSAADMAQFANAYPNGDRTIPSNSEAETYVDYNPASPSNPFSFGDGALTITARPTSAGSGSYTSGLLTTAQTFSQNQGYFEIRAKVPNAAGFWPAFWMLPPDLSDEVDVMEQPNNDGIQNYFLSVKAGPQNFGGYQNTGTDLSAGYHTYGFMWTPYTVQFTFDGNEVGYAVGTPPNLANVKMFLLANLAVGGPGSWPGVPAAGASASYSIDYIRAFSSDPTVPGVAQQAISSPDGVDTDPGLLPVLPTVGTGSDALVLSVNEDAYKGDAQFTVSVDGKQQGGTFTASASSAFKQTQALTIKGSFDTGAHAVTVDFLNDLYDGSPSTDRNLYVTQVSLNGTTLRNASLALMANGPQSIGFTGAATAQAYPLTTELGTGPDVLSLKMAEDAYQGDAQFTLSVDGVAIGGTQTVTALHDPGATQSFDVHGTFAPGNHTVSVNFLNDAYGGSQATDRNLYVVGASIDNTPIPAGHLVEQSEGPQSFSFQKGADTLTVGVSEDAYEGDAQYRILVDGSYVGGTYTATASHTAGLINQQTVSGTWGKGAHTVGVQFVNDAYGSSPGADRNLYVNSVQYDGWQVDMGVLEQASNGIASITVPPLSNVLTLHLAEDAYGGDAQFAVTVDGAAVNQATPVTASHAAGASQAFTFLTGLTAGTHDVGVTFLNDLYGGNPLLDRNLYVVGAELNGTPQSAYGWTDTLLSDGTKHFSLVVPS